MKLTLAHALMIAASGLLLATGCETGRTNKVHASWQMMSDETTVGQPEMANAAPATGQPPTPTCAVTWPDTQLTLGSSSA